MFQFGSGIMWGTPTQDATGAAVAVPTPLIFGTMQDSELEFKFELKQLHGSNQFAVAVGRGKGTVSGKCKMADLRARFLETVIFGQAGSAGVEGAVYDTVGAAVPTTPFQITPTVPASGTWSADMGVIDASTGREMVRVSSAPATGQYSVAAGVYTFAAADVAKVVYISFRYTATSTVARKMELRNLPMGYAPTFRADFYGPYLGKSAVLTLNQCIADGFKMPNKNDDFSIPEFGFMSFANAAGVIGTLALSE